MRPYRVLIFIACVLACLAVLCLVLPHEVPVGDRTLRWPALAEVLELNEPAPDLSFEEDEPILVDSIAPADTVSPFPSGEGREEAAPVKPIEVPNLVIDSTTDTRVFLRTFYAALAESSERIVRIVHYGDSQIEEDRMTQQIRELFQSRYGGSGAGLLPLAQTIPSRTVRQEIYLNGRPVSPKQGPRRYLVYGLKRDQRQDGLYGMMGQVAVMADSLVSGSEEVTAVCRPQIPSARYDTWRIFADSTITCSLSGDTVRLSGKGAVYGLSQQTTTGVIVDNIPMRGCLGMVFTKMDSTQLATFYRQENVRLIIMQFGGNAIPTNERPETIRGFISGYRDQIHRLRACAPGASILFIGPSDMIRMVDGEWQTYPMVPYMDKLLRKMAQEEGIAYFSLYRWMGGAGSMLRWKENGLAGEDGVHFFRSGARKAGDAVANWLMEGMSKVQSDKVQSTKDEVQMPNNQ